MNAHHSNSKIDTDHLQRNAYLYVRQSTLHQVIENSESTERQYALREHACVLGWSPEQVVIVDGDQGQSGASADDREGFQYLVAEVGMGRAGIVMGLEVSRLARNNADWHRLLEICALSGTLILDEDGVYDPAHYNDRLLLGLKGTMSEAELHILRARLQGGLLNQARRGALKLRLPTGFVYDALDRVVLDPDKEVQESFRLFFKTFARTGTAHATVKYWRDHELRFPRRVHTGPCRGGLVWGTLTGNRAYNVLCNPRYAGAFVYGRRRQVRRGGGKVRQVAVGRDQWIVLLPDAHEGYITWSEYEENQARMRNNSQVQREARKSVPREGPALLQGLALCGRCGRRMTVRYHRRKEELTPEYVCDGLAKKEAAPVCQFIPGAGIDEAIGDLLLEVVSPAAMEVSLAVQQELRDRIEEADRLRFRQVERAQQEAELARQRFLQVNPSNRMVADVLEADWNNKLRALAAARDDYERKRQQDRLILDDHQRDRIRQLSSDFRAVWHSPATDHRDRKRMVRLLIEDVTLVKGDEITIHVRFRGGATRTLTTPRPKPAWELRRTPREVVDRIDQLLDQHTDSEIAEILNAEGLRSGEGHTFQADRVNKVRRAYKLRSRRTRLRERGLLTLGEIATRLGISTWTVKKRRLRGTLCVRAIRLDDTGAYMYENPSANARYVGQHHSSCR